MPETPACTQISLSLLIAPKGDKHQITFGITRGCPEGKPPSWSISFLLEEKDGETWKKRVDFKLDINVEAPAKTDKAEKLADERHLNRRQAEWVTGPMYVAAIRESRPSPLAPELIDLINKDASAFEEGRGAKGEDGVFGLEGKAAEKLTGLLSARAARRPTLKELSIMFLDID